MKFHEASLPITVYMRGRGGAEFSGISRESWIDSSAIGSDPQPDLHQEGIRLDKVQYVVCATLQHKKEM